MLDYELDEFEYDENIDEDNIYGELDDLAIGEDSGICRECGDPNAKMGIDPYSDSTGGVYYCDLCAPSDLLIIY